VKLKIDIAISFDGMDAMEAEEMQRNIEATLLAYCPPGFELESHVVLGTYFYSFKELEGEELRC
jgi:hypothetical protein